MISPLAELPGRRLDAGETFCFRCHAGLACFNACCRGKRLQLMPYDLLRLRRALQLSSEQLLASHVELELEPATGWPCLRVRLGDDGECPFVSAAGCRVYQHRPTCCRIYPLARASRPGAGGVEEIFLCEETPACLGWAEPRRLSVETWVAEQGLAEYLAANAGFRELLLQRPRDGLSERQVHAIIFGLYNLDLFRQALPALADRLAAGAGALAVALGSDEALLELGQRWVAAELGAAGAAGVSPGETGR